MKNDKRDIGRDPHIAPGVYYLEQELSARIDGDRIIVEKKESEDERIRKAVLKGIEYLEMDEGWDSIGDIDILDAKQWLEKQKESLHISETCKENTDSFTDEDEDRTINGCLLAANAERRCKRASEELLEELGLADYTKFFYEQGVEKGKKEREKQKEQKSVPSREMILGIWELGNFWKESPEARDGLTQLQYIQKYWNEKCDYKKEQKHSLNFDAISSWLRDHVSRYVNSEYNEFHHCTEYDGTINVEKLIADLKVAVDSGTFDIHEQKEQKPAEWSEEDEENLGKLHRLLVICQGEKKFIPSDEYDKLDDWLKSLRPPQYCENCKLKHSVENWKPSDEQMEALKCVVEDVARFSKRGGRQVELENEPYYSALHSLYCNLEKLM